MTINKFLLSSYGMYVYLAVGRSYIFHLFKCCLFLSVFTAGDEIHWPTSIYLLNKYNFEIAMSDINITN